MNNFEKNKSKINIELEQRLRKHHDRYTTELSKYNNIKDKLSNNSNDNYYFIENNNIMFETLKNKIIISNNKELIKDTMINYNKLSSCEIKNIKFENCSFYGTTFSNCSFENVTFDRCSFNNVADSTTIFENQCKFDKCRFLNCNMEKIIFINNSFYDVKFVLNNIKNSIFDKMNIESLVISDSDLRGIKIINTSMEYLLFEDEFLTKLDEESFIDEIIIDKKNLNNTANAFKIYKDISTKFQANRLPNKAGEYYYLYKSLERKTLKGQEKINSYIYWLLCGYGEKPTYALVTSIEIVLIFTILYMFTGLSIGLEVIDYSILIYKELPSQDLIIDFLRSLYFSVVTFTTVGYGDITPIGNSVFLSGIEMFLGVTMVGIWTATLARKITR